MRKTDIKNGTTGYFKKIFFLFILSLSLLSLPNSLYSQQTDDGWHFKAAPYMLFPYMNGDVNIKGIPVDVNSTPNDVFSHLKFGMMANLEAYNQNWAIMADALYFKLGMERSIPVNRDADLEIEQFAFLTSGLYRFTPWFEGGVALIVNSLGASLKAEAGNVAPGIDLSDNYNWVDPAIALRFKNYQFEDKLLLSVFGYVGGFGLGSDLAWQINPLVGYRFSRLFEVDLGYRWIYMDYNDGDDFTDFVYDVTTSGFEIRITFNF